MEFAQGCADRRSFIVYRKNNVDIGALRSALAVVICRLHIGTIYTTTGYIDDASFTRCRLISWAASQHVKLELSGSHRIRRYHSPDDACVGPLGIESDFAGQAVGYLQDLVTKQHALETDGALGLRGVVANKGAARLHVTDALRGSFGFMLEELHPEETFVPTSLKEALDHVTALLRAFAERDKARFDSAVENVDQRVLATAGEFFSYLNREGATLRLVSGDADRSFDEDAIKRAMERASTTTVSDKDEDIRGQLAGVLPDRHLFEFRCEGPRGVISGKVDKSLTASSVADLQREWVNRTAVGVFRVRQVMTRGELVRETFTLKNIRKDQEHNG